MLIQKKGTGKKVNSISNNERLTAVLMAVR